MSSRWSGPGGTTAGPTGGITLGNAADYLALPNVVCVGGSWIATDADVNAENWGAIQERAHAAARLSRG